MAAELVSEHVPDADLSELRASRSTGVSGAVGTPSTGPGAPSVVGVGDLGELLEAAHRVVARLGDAAAELGSRGVTGGRAALGVLPRVDALVNRVVALQADLVGLAGEHVTAADLGPDRSFTEARERQTRSGRGAVRAVEARARVLREVPGLREDLADGEISLAHLDTVGRVLDAAGEGTRRRMVGEAPVILASARELSAPDLRRELDARRTAIEAEQADRSFAAVRARRFLRWGSRGGGVSLEGLLDPVAAATMRTALDAVTPVPAADDERSGEQRGADALVLLAQRTLGVGVDKVGSQLRPQLSVLVRQDTWLLLLQRRRSLSCQGGASSGDGASTDGAGWTQRAGEAGAGPGAVLTGADDGVGRGHAVHDCRAGDCSGEASAGANAGEVPLAQLEDGTLVPFAALEVLLCDAFVQRTVLDPDGVPLDLGRTQRTWSKDARRAILIRDRHCQWPGCTLRASWCEIHHLVRWADGGPTDRDNGITLCSEHHHRAHDRAVWIRPERGGFVFTSADGTRIGATSRLHDHLLVPRPPGTPPGQVPGAPPGGLPGGPPTRGPEAPPLGAPVAPPRGAPGRSASVDADESPDGCPAALW